MSLRQASSDGSGRLLPVKIAVLAVALVGLTYFLFLKSADNNAQLDTPDSATPYVCWDDGHVFRLTPAEWERWSKEGRVKAEGATEAGGDLNRNARLLVQCPKCGKFTCVRGLECPNGKIVPFVTRDNQAGKCTE